MRDHPASIFPLKPLKIKRLQLTESEADNEQPHLQCQILCVTCAHFMLSMSFQDRKIRNTPHPFLQLIDGVGIPQVFHLLSRGFILKSL